MSQSSTPRVPRLLYVITEDWYFCSHRLEHALAAKRAGYQVAVATNVEQHGDAIRTHGIELLPFAWKRRSMNPWAELHTLWRLYRLYRAWRPNLVHHVAIKPVLYGSFAARAASVPVAVNAIAGLGYIFTSTDRRARMLRPFIRLAYRFALRRPGSYLIVQNPDDRETLLSASIASPKNTVLIRGTGVDTDRLRPHRSNAERPLVVLPARLLRDKGVWEFVEAARQLRPRCQARFALVGDVDSHNPASLTAKQVEMLKAEGIVECWGWRDDMAEVLSQAHVVCLPSYREGLPKALIEAAACGLPIVTTDVPGCREVVQHGVNGLLVPARDAQMLALALERLILNESLRMQMGAASRSAAEEHFSLRKTVSATLELYRRALAQK